MSQAQVLAPVFVQIALTFALLLMTGRSRIGALNAGEVKLRDIALGQNAWPTRPTQISRAFQNQLELPLLFYALVAFVLIERQQSTLFVALEWLFVALRLAHAVEHVTANNVRRRFAAYVAGFAVLALMWAWFAWRVLVG